ncbi:MAG TPA: MMPL family transporter [Thermoleophilaceae bacterium]
MLERIAALTWNRPRLVLAVVFGIAALAGAVGHDVEKRLKAAGFTDSASESERATATMRGALGYDANPALVVLLRAKGGGRLDPRAPAVRREVGRLHAELARTRYVGHVDPPLPARDGRSLVLAGHLVTADLEDRGGLASEDARDRLRSTSLDVSLGGFATAFNEVNDQTREDLTNAELIAFPALTVLLLLVFRGAVAAAIPLVLGVLSILGTFLALRVMSGLFDTSLFALNITTALSLGLAVDYSLLLVSRYREETERGGFTAEAHRRTVVTAGRAVVFSGFTVAASMVALVLFPQRFLYSLGAAGAVVGVLSAVIAVLVTPSLLRLAGPRINSLSVRRGPSVTEESDRWFRLARAVMRRPVAVALASSALLLALAAPLAGTLLTGPSAEAVPPGQPSYDGARYVERHYPRGVSEGVTVTVHGRASARELGRLGRRLRELDGVAGAAPLARAGADVAYTTVSLRGPALAEASQETVRAIRALAPPRGTELLVSGNTARFIDQKASLRDHAPLVVLIIVAGTFLLLFALTGSVVLPLKTLLMNALTLFATLGILVLAFQHGWLAAPLGYDGPEAVEVTSLVFLFANIFGLATDYAVLVVARIKEQHDRGVPDGQAIAAGVARTGRVISAAAAMIAVVFVAFAVSPVFFMKQIAIGMAVGVILDATIVRALLVPSLMRLLGERNWWAPAPLRRLQRRFALSEGEA